LAKLILNGATSGSVTLESPAVSGTTTLTLPTTTDTLVGKTTTDTLTNKTLTSPAIAGTPTGVGVLTAATAQATTSGTSKDFTDIPSWVKRITVMYNGVSKSGSALPLIQLGDSGGIETTGYLSASTQTGSSTATQTSTAGFVLNAGGSGNVFHGAIVLNLLDSTNNIWVANGTLSFSDVAFNMYTGGSKSLSATLDRVRITTSNGTDTFDAGSVNIMYE
jgi:hypothetical protein